MRVALLAVATLLRREVVRFVRQRSRLVGALVQPLVFWVLLGAGLKASFRPASGTGSVEYFYPGIIALTLLFTAIFATISVVEDRKAGFLQGVLVSPVPRWSVVMGQAAGSTTLALIQGILLLALAPVAGIPLTAAGVLQASAVMLLLGFGMSSLGLVLAWRMESTQGFHAIMNLVLMPMWLLSGAFFPIEGAPRVLEWTMKLNPMTYGMAALRRGLYAGSRASLEGLPPMGLSLGVLVVFGMAAFLSASALARKA